MAETKKIRLRTAFPGDVYRLDDRTEITSSGTEVAASKADDLIRAAQAAGVRLFPMEDPTDAPVRPAPIQTGGNG